MDRGWHGAGWGAHVPLSRSNEAWNQVGQRLGAVRHGTGRHRARNDVGRTGERQLDRLPMTVFRCNAWRLPYGL